MDAHEDAKGTPPAGDTRRVGGNWLIPVGLALGALLLALATALVTNQLAPEAPSLRDAPPPAPRP